MIASLVLSTLAALVTSPVADTIPFALGRAGEVRVRVTRDAHEYVETITAVPADGDGFVVRRTQFEPILVFGVDPAQENMLPAQLEWLALTGTSPAMRVDESGSFVRFEGVDAAWKELRRGLAQASSTPSAMTGAPLSPMVRRLWLPSTLSAWGTWAEGWAGVPVEPGTFEREGRWFAGTRAEEPLAVTFHFEVREPILLDGRRAVRVIRIARVRSEQLAVGVIDFLTSIGSAPSDSRYAKSCRTAFETRAVFDAETWLPIAVDTVTRTTIRMQSPRSNWRETVEHQASYSLEWGAGPDDGSQ